MVATVFIKRPVKIQAVQFTGKNGKDVMTWIKENGGDGRNGGRYLLIDTLEGRMKAKKGDMIIRGVKGEFYPCDKDIFIESYSIPKTYRFEV